MALTKTHPEQKITQAEVIKELPLEKVIDNTLAKSNVTKKVLNALKEKYLSSADDNKLALKEEFVLKNPTDKETYLIVKEERKGVRKIGIITEDLCKKGRADAISIQKLWLGKEKEILDEVAIVQDKLDAQIKIFEEEEKRLAQVEEERKDEQFNIRQAQLIKMGSVSANGCMNINDLSIENSNIREADDETYNETILPLFKMHYEKNEEKRVEEEKNKQKEKEEFEKKQNELILQQEEFEKKQKELQQQQEQFQQQQKEAQQLKTKNRCLQLESLGMKFSLQHDSYVFEDVNINSSTEISLLDDAAWETKLQEIKPVIETRKKEAAIREERKSVRSVQLSELGMTFTGNAYKFDDINIPATDITGMEDVNWNQLIATTEPMIADRKQKAEEKKQQEWQKQQDELREKQKQQQEEEDAKASDKDKWFNLIAIVTAVPMPEFKSPAYKAKANQLLAKINEIKSL